MAADQFARRVMASRQVMLGRQAMLGRGDASIKFFEESGLLKKGAVTFNQSFDTGPLDKVLKKIGRK